MHCAPRLKILALDFCFSQIQRRGSSPAASRRKADPRVTKSSS